MGNSQEPADPDEVLSLRLHLSQQVQQVGTHRRLRHPALTSEVGKREQSPFPDEIVWPWSLDNGLQRRQIAVVGTVRMPRKAVVIASPKIRSDAALSSSNRHKGAK